jgi:hypothetical protein
MNFWEGFFQLPDIFVMGFLVALLVGLFLLFFELANRKLRIDKTGVTFDRLRDRKPLIIRVLEARHKSKEKISLNDL